MERPPLKKSLYIPRKQQASKICLPIRPPKGRSSASHVLELEQVEPGVHFSPLQTTHKGGLVSSGLPQVWRCHCPIAVTHTLVWGSIRKSHKHPFPPNPTCSSGPGRDSIRFTKLLLKLDHIQFPALSWMCTLRKAITEDLIEAFRDSTIKQFQILSKFQDFVHAEKLSSL